MENHETNILRVVKEEYYERSLKLFLEENPFIELCPEYVTEKDLIFGKTYIVVKKSKRTRFPGCNDWCYIVEKVVYKNYQDLNGGIKKHCFVSNKNNFTYTLFITSDAWDNSEESPIYNFFENTPHNL